MGESTDFRFTEEETETGSGSIHEVYGDEMHCRLAMGSYLPAEDESLSYRSMIKLIGFSIELREDTCGVGDLDTVEELRVEGSMRVSFNDSRKHILKINFDMDPDDFIRIMDQEPPVERFTDLIGFLSDIYERSEDPKKSRVVFVEKNVWVIDT
jgi:hypothetical protein